MRSMAIQSVGTISLETGSEKYTSSIINKSAGQAFFFFDYNGDGTSASDYVDITLEYTLQHPTDNAVKDPTVSTNDSSFTWKKLCQWDESPTAVWKPTVKTYRIDRSKTALQDRDPSLAEILPAGKIRVGGQETLGGGGSAGTLAVSIGTVSLS